METTLHRQLKTLYTAAGDVQEKSVAGFRVDVAKRDCVVEIQHSSLNAIRGKVTELLATHRVLVVKPFVVKKRIVRLNRKGGQVVSRRWSPKQGQLVDLFDELIYFREIFPHANLTLEIPLVQIEEWRYQGHGRRARLRANDYQLQDQLLLAVDGTMKIRRAADLWQLLVPPNRLTFTTEQLANHWKVPRYQAQKIAYTLQHCEVLERVSKSGNAWVYSVTTSAEPAKRVAG